MPFETTNKNYYLKKQKTPLIGVFVFKSFSYFKLLIRSQCRLMHLRLVCCKELLWFEINRQLINCAGKIKWQGIICCINFCTQIQTNIKCFVRDLEEGD